MTRIHQNKPATLRDALGTALQLESYQLASKQKARFVWEAQLEERHPVQKLKLSKLGQDLLQSQRLKAFWDSAPIIVASSLHLLKLHIL